MQIELHQLELRYEKLRKTSVRAERQLTASLSDIGQQLPIIVVEASEPGRYVVVDGYKRVRALRRLRQDTVDATLWQLEESQALVLERLMRTADSDGPIEQGWLLRELRERFGLGIDELGRRFDKTASWVSRRLGLIEELPEAIQQHVRADEIGAHAAMKYLVPLARANLQDCVKLAGALAKRKATSRQVGALYAQWVSGTRKTRELLVADPWLCLRVQEQARKVDEVEKSAAQQLRDDLEAIGGLARRARRKLEAGLWSRMIELEREELERCMAQAKHEIGALFERFENKENCNVGSEHPDSDPQVA
jgi:ParB family chromosome partitioning protein